MPNCSNNKPQFRCSFEVTCHTVKYSSSMMHLQKLILLLLKIISDFGSKSNTRLTGVNNSICTQGKLTVDQSGGTLEWYGICQGCQAHSYTNPQYSRNLGALWPAIFFTDKPGARSSLYKLTTGPPFKCNTKILSLMLIYSKVQSHSFSQPHQTTWSFFISKYLPPSVLSDLLIPWDHARWEASSLSPTGLFAVASWQTAGGAHSDRMFHWLRGWLDRIGGLIELWVEVGRPTCSIQGALHKDAML